MTGKPDDFFRALFEALSAIERGEKPASISDATRRASLKKISDMVDLDLVNALTQWVMSQRDADKPFTNGQLCSSMAYWLALSITESLLIDKKPEDQVCILTELYGDYIHNVSHAIYRGEKDSFGK
jgi:hypothetical protein